MLTLGAGSRGETAQPPTLIPAEDEVRAWHTTRRLAACLFAALMILSHLPATAADGRVARFDGGYFRTSAGDQKIHLRGQEMTLYVRLEDSDGQWSVPLFSKDEP